MLRSCCMSVPGTRGAQQERGEHGECAWVCAPLQGPTHRYGADGNGSFGNPCKCALFWSAVQIRHSLKKKKVNHEEFLRFTFSPCAILSQGAGCPELRVE